MVPAISMPAKASAWRNAFFARSDSANNTPRPSLGTRHCRRAYRAKPIRAGGRAEDVSSSPRLVLAIMGCDVRRAAAQMAGTALREVMADMLVMLDRVLGQGPALR